MAAKTNPNWPVLTNYEQQNLGRIALGLGGGLMIWLEAMETQMRVFTVR